MSHTQPHRIIHSRLRFPYFLDKKPRFFAAFAKVKKDDLGQHVVVEYEDWYLAYRPPPTIKVSCNGYAAACKH